MDADYGWRRRWAERGCGSIPGVVACAACRYARSLPDLCALCRRCRGCAPGHWRTCAAGTRHCGPVCPDCVPEHGPHCLRAG